MKRVGMLLSLLLCCVSFFSLSLSQAADVTLYVENSSGIKGSPNNPVQVSLDNPSHKVRKVRANILDDEGFLDLCGDETSCNCETTGRSPGFTCVVYEITGGVHVELTGDEETLIDIGSGAILTLRYDVSDVAPAGECRDLNIDSPYVKDENNNPLSVEVKDPPGEFCFYSCTDNSECDDDNVCTDDFCGWRLDFIDGTSPFNQATLTGYSSGATGEILTYTKEGGNWGTGDAYGILFLGDVSGTFQEDEIITDDGSPPGIGRAGGTTYNHACYYLKNSNPCEDGVYCNGVEYCAGGSCHSPPAGPCPPPLTCNEQYHVCNCSEPDDCDDDLFCNGVEDCVDGGAQGFICQDGADPCAGYAGCDEEADVCYQYSGSVGVNDEEGIIGDRLMWNIGYDDGTEAFTVGAIVEGQSSEATGEIVSIQGNVTAGTLTLVLDNIHDTFEDGELIIGDPTGSATVNGTATLDYPDPVVAVTLNRSDYIKGIQVFICEEVDSEEVDDLEAVPDCSSGDGCDPPISGCTKIGLPAGFTCSAQEMEGCALISLYNTACDEDHLAQCIPPGSGTIFTLKYGVKEGVPTGEVDHVPIILALIIADGSEIYPQPIPGEFTIKCDDDEQCVWDDGLFCNGVDDSCNPQGSCVSLGYPCTPDYCCNEVLDACIPHEGDTDCDGVLDEGGIEPCDTGETENCDDNCLNTPNGPVFGTCVKILSGLPVSTGVICTSDGDCNETCQKNQSDWDDDGRGDACTCHADFTEDGKVFPDDALILLNEWKRKDCYTNPCQADIDGDGKVFPSDAMIMIEEWKRKDCQVLP